MNRTQNFATLWMLGFIAGAGVALAYDWIPGVVGCIVAAYGGLILGVCSEGQR